jgi:hypothetical protein
VPNPMLRRLKAMQGKTGRANDSCQEHRRWAERISISQTAIGEARVSEVRNGIDDAHAGIRINMLTCSQWEERT